tara:strand:- start:690 stop:845 length:156 start_codon:yes stop_codon:yes gene_type:complete
MVSHSPTSSQKAKLEVPKAKTAMMLRMLNHWMTSSQKAKLEAVAKGRGTMM